MQAYRLGRLDFSYPTPLSYLREQFILNDLEREILTDAYRLKTVISSNIIPVNPQEGIKRVNKFLNGYMELSLPYLFKDGKLISDNTHLGEVTTDKLSEWNKILEEYNKDKKTKN
jgi:hypothetical protein